MTVFFGMLSCCFSFKASHERSLFIQNCEKRQSQHRKYAIIETIGVNLLVAPLIAYVASLRAEAELDDVKNQLNALQMKPTLIRQNASNETGLQDVTAGVDSIMIESSRDDVSGALQAYRSLYAGLSSKIDGLEDKEINRQKFETELLQSLREFSVVEKETTRLIKNIERLDEQYSRLVASGSLSRLEELDKKIEKLIPLENKYAQLESNMNSLETKLSLIPATVGDATSELKSLMAQIRTIESVNSKLQESSGFKTTSQINIKSLNFKEVYDPRHCQSEIAATGKRNRKYSTIHTS